jgi:hypothetical protein
LHVREETPLVRWRRLIPQPSDLVFALVLLFVVIGGRYALFNDPGTLWHLRLGRDGISPLVAVFVALLAVSIGQIHFLIRPHIFTLALVYATLRLCQKQHERGGWLIAWVPVLTAILANVHGGFLALPGIVATAAGGHAVSVPLDQARRRNVAKYVLVFVASCLAASINPSARPRSSNMPTC